MEESALFIFSESEEDHMLEIKLRYCMAHIKTH